MISFSMISFLFGAALGQRFKVLVLVPAMAIVIMIALGAGVMQAQSAWWIVLMAVSASTCLQFGYFAGIGVRQFLAAAPSTGALRSAEHHHGMPRARGS
jgi:hypothetical protein